MEYMYQILAERNEQLNYNRKIKIVFLDHDHCPLMSPDFTKSSDMDFVSTR